MGAYSKGIPVILRTDIAGTSTHPVETSVANENFIQLYTKSTATSGTSRGIYARHYLAGAGGDGEALRAFTTINANVGASAGVHGAHCSVNFGTSGVCGGQAVAHRATFHIPNSAMAAGGTFAAQLVEVVADGTSSDPSAVTEFSLLKLSVSGGNATATAKVKNAMSIATTAADGSGNMVYSHDHAAGNAAGSIRILVNGAVKYLKFWAAE